MKKNNRCIKKIISTILLCVLVLTFVSINSMTISAEATVYYTHTLSAVPVKGNNTLGDLIWDFSMAGNGSIETGSSGRGARFAVADDSSKELTIKTTVSNVEITRIAVEAAMGGGGNTVLSVSVGGVSLGSGVSVSNTIGLYSFNFNSINGEIIISLKATAAGIQSYLKSITIYTGISVKTAKVNYHGHTYRCNHAGTSEDEAYVMAAINNDYTTIGFSDHVMLPWISYDNSVRGRYRQAEEYYNSIRSLQDKYEGVIDILLGYESEWVTGGLFEDYYRYLIDNNIVDYLIFGNHWQRFDEVNYRFIASDESNINEPEHVRGYTAAAIEAIETGLFSVFAHPEVFFASGYGNVQTFTSEMKTLVRQMCEAALRENVALELNQGYVGNMETRACYTEFWDIVKDVGNTVVIGVDAHSPGAYNESVRKRVIAFADNIGLTITEDLGISRKSPNPDATPFVVEGIPVENDETDVAAVKNILSWGRIRGINTSENAVAFNLSLPLKLNDCTISWSSDKPSVISDAGSVTRLGTATIVALTATIQLGNAVDTKTFTLIVLPSGVVPDAYVPDFLEYPTAWASNNFAATVNSGSVVFTAAAMGGGYQNTKLTLGEAVTIPQSIWEETYLEYDFTVTGGTIQLTMSYMSSISNTTIVNLGQLMDNDTSSNADHYHGSKTGRLSFKEISDYINTQPNAGWGAINKINNGPFLIKEITLWLTPQNTSASFNTFRIVYEDDNSSSQSANLIVTASPSEGGKIKIDNGELSTSINEIYEIGTDITVTAVANDNYSFDGWYENDIKVSSMSVYTFTIISDTTLEARFQSGGINKDSLRTSITNAQNALDNAKVGTSAGDYPQSVIDAYREAIDKANSVLSNSNATQEEIDAALSELQLATNVFNNSVNSSKLIYLWIGLGILGACLIVGVGLTIFIKKKQGIK